MDELKFRLQDAVTEGAELPFEDLELPLDAILTLLSKNRMEIADLKISELLDQYLEYIRESGLDLDVASEFSVMASHLVYLKSRMLLAAGRDDEDADMALLLKALEERKSREQYERIKLAAAHLEMLSAAGRDFFPKPPEQLARDTEYRREHKPEELKLAMEELSERAARRAPPKQTAFRGIVGVEPYPVRQKIDALLRRLEVSGEISSPFDGAESRSEMIATFLAILELCRESKIYVEIADGERLIVKRKQ